MTGRLLAVLLFAGPAAAEDRALTFERDVRPVLRAEAHLSYRVPTADPTRVTFAWADAAGSHTAEHTFAGTPGGPAWLVPTGAKVETQWVEMAPAGR